MAIRSKRALRSIFSRKYSNLGEKPIKVVDAGYEDYESGCAFDRILVCKSTDQEESKDDDDDDYIALTEKAAVAVVRDASALTDLIASRLAKANCASENFEEEKEEEPLEEVKAEEVPVVEATVVEAPTEPKPETEATPVEENKGFVETSKARVVVAFEACITSGKGSMISAEESSQAAIEQRLPLSPLLEQASERLEAIMAQVIEEAQEFFWDHWNMLQNCSAATSARFQKSACGSISNVISENPTPKTTIEVQMQTSE